MAFTSPTDTAWISSRERLVLVNRGVRPSRPAQSVRNLPVIHMRNSQIGDVTTAATRYARSTKLAIGGAVYRAHDGRKPSVGQGPPAFPEPPKLASRIIRRPNIGSLRLAGGPSAARMNVVLTLRNDASALDGRAGGRLDDGTSCLQPRGGSVACVCVGGQPGGDHRPR